MVAHQKAIVSLWTGICTIYTRAEQVNQTNKRIEFVETAIIEDEPCRLSFKNSSPVSISTDVAENKQIIKLFLSPNVVVPMGSKITVTQNGVTNTYRRSGEPCIFSYHQEILLENFEKWA